MINLRTATDADPARPGQTVIASADDERPCGHVKGDHAHGLDCATVAEWDAASAEFRASEGHARLVELAGGANELVDLVDQVIDEPFANDNSAPTTLDELDSLTRVIVECAHLLDGLIDELAATAHTLPTVADRDELGWIGDNLARAWALTISARRDLRTFTRARS